MYLSPIWEPMLCSLTKTLLIMMQWIEVIQNEKLKQRAEL